MEGFQIFNFNGTEIRVFQDENQDPLFIAKEVAAVLGYSDTQVMTRRLDEDEKGMRELHTLGGKQMVTVITESGFYNAVLGSSRPEKKVFKKWVTSTVLPSIRKHGAFLTNEKVEEALLNPDTLILLANTIKDERKAKEEALNQLEIASHKNSSLQTQVAVLSPKAEYHDEVLVPTALLTVNMIAADLGITAIKLNALLIEWDIQYKQSQTYMLHAKYRGRDLTDYKTFPKKGSETGETVQHMYWTQIGRKFIIETYNSRTTSPQSTLQF